MTLILALVLSVESNAAASALKVHFLDVGYADATLIQTPDQHTVLIDAAGPEQTPQIIEYLKALNLTTIDALILTHPDENHFGGMLKITENFAVTRFYHTGELRPDLPAFSALLTTLKSRKIPLLTLGRDERLMFGDVQFHVLHPASLKGSPNENSLVLKLAYGKIAFLFTADIQPAQQAKILELYPEISDSDCVQVPHHGGLIDERFARAFPKAIFIMSTGKNIYGKPLSDELEKLPAEVLRTDIRGTILVESNGENLTVTSQRDHD